jgi:hypothetical protein
MAPHTISTDNLALTISNIPDAAVVECRGTLTLENHGFLKHQVKVIIACNPRIVLDLTS